MPIWDDVACGNTTVIEVDSPRTSEKKSQRTRAMTAPWPTRPTWGNPGSSELVRRIREEGIDGRRSAHLSGAVRRLTTAGGGGSVGERLPFVDANQDEEGWAALGDPTRRAIVAALAERPRAVGE